MPDDVSPAFGSFWSGGFEGADHVNGLGVALDMATLTGHLPQLRGDYRRARAAGLATVRESVGWRIASSTDGSFDFARVHAMLAEARRARLEIAWTLWHYGIPADVDPFAPTLAARLADFAGAFARAVAGSVPDDVWINPVNEISFLTWLYTESGLVHRFPGCAKEKAAAFKLNLVRAAIHATAAVRLFLPRARFFHTDPIIGVVPPRDDPAGADAARISTEAQYESWDLFGDPAFVPAVPVADRFHLVGVNYYHSSQWEEGTRRTLHWHLGDKRRLPLAPMLAATARRFDRPVIISETSHVGIGRGSWLSALARDLALDEGLPAACAGICLYPLIDRPDWDDPRRWHRSGLWDVAPRIDARGGRRIVVRPYWQALRRIAAHTSSHSRGASGTSSRARRRASQEGHGMKTLIVFSHLRWDFVYQRPQHVLTRLARRWHILFVEEPLRHNGDPTVETIEVDDNVTVLRFHTPLAAGGFHDQQLALLKPMLADVLAERGISDYGVWFYTPMALPLIQGLKPRIICYDCMDELSAFLNSPKQLLQRESALLRIANVVFAGGPSLFRAKQKASDNVHCLPSSVDAMHFRRGRDPANALPELCAFPRPRLGFYGVVDERFDTDLLARCAMVRSDWHFEIVGPVVKIDRAALPQRPNIHYFGHQPYANLPGVLAAWDIALLPFARNDATRFISPTKTLEYLAADRPVVSTRIADVVELYGSVVAVADNASGFISACERFLAETPELSADRIAAGRALVETTSWDVVADKMIEEIDRALQHGLKPDVQLLFAEGGAMPPVERGARLPKRAGCLVAGAGPTGLAAAYYLGRDATLVEARDTVGGWCRSIRDGGFTFDHAGHIMFSDDAEVLALYTKLLGDNVHWQNREAWVYSHGTHTRYPFQGALYGLPPAVVKECLLGAIEARYGAASVRAAAANGGDASANDCCADGTSVADGCRDARDENAPPANFEEFIYRTWGRGIAAHFAIPYNRKLWGVPLSEMETSWLGGRVPLPDLAQMIEGALTPVPRPMGPNARFGYPLRGGFQALMDGFLPLIEGTIELNAEVRRVSAERHEVELHDGRLFRYDHLISTLPLPDLVNALGTEAPPHIRAAAAKLRRVSVRCVNLGIGRPNLTEKHWIYYPGDTIFHRVFVQGNASPHCNAPGGFGLTCEISYSATKPLPLDGGQLIARCIADCIRVGLFDAGDPVWVANEVDMPYAYVLYDHSRAAAVATIREWLAHRDIVLAGRYSEWEYYNSDHAFLAGKRAAETVAGGQTAALPPAKRA